MINYIYFEIREKNSIKQRIHFIDKSDAFSII